MIYAIIILSRQYTSEQINNEHDCNVLLFSSQITVIFNNNNHNNNNNSSSRLLVAEELKNVHANNYVFILPG